MLHFTFIVANNAPFLYLDLVKQHIQHNITNYQYHNDLFILNTYKKRHRKKTDFLIQHPRPGESAVYSVASDRKKSCRPGILLFPSNFEDLHSKGTAY